MLFVPRHRDRGVLSSRKEPGLMLYSHNVLIQEYSADLLPTWLSFVDGVVDSEDLPLNVSRETVQNNRLIQQLGKTLRGRVLRELKKLGESDSNRYAQFYEAFGAVLKEGLATDPAARDDILPLLRYRSTRSGDNWTSLDAVIDRLPAEADTIYYVLGDTFHAAVHSPHLDPFRGRDLEVLLWHDPLDVFLAPTMESYRDKRFRNVADANIELPPSEAPETETERQTPEPDFNRFLGRCVTTLGDRVAEVRASRVLTDSPARLVSPDGQGVELQRIYRMMGREYDAPPLVLELNRNHPLIAGLSALATNQPDSPLLPLAVEHLYAGALLQEGLYPNPSEILPGVQEMMRMAVEAMNGGGEE
jgi:molecular chaperone HtpG